MARRELIRARLAHTPLDPFSSPGALVTFEDGGLLIEDGVIAACGPFGAVRSTSSETEVVDLRDGFVVPGFVDAHVHYPQVRVLGGLGLDLLSWLDRIALPEEARMADEVYATDTARRFVSALLQHGTTTALAFGAHFAGATAALFDEARRVGLRLTAGLVLSDRALRPDLHQTPDAAYRESLHLIDTYHANGRLEYAVTPRFAVSTSEAMLEICQSLVTERPDVRVQSHINENAQEIRECLRAFPWARDYLAIYERHGLIGRRTVLAHNVHATDFELERLASSSTSVAHCPCSNAALGSGIFPLKRHVAAGVHCALGTDVGGGTGFGLLKEGLQAYLLQRVAADGAPLSPAHLLYLATRAGAVALGRHHTIGDFTPGQEADFVHLRPPKDGVLAGAIDRAEDLEQALAALFTLGDSECVSEVRIAGAVVYSRP